MKLFPPLLLLLIVLTNLLFIATGLDPELGASTSYDLSLRYCLSWRLAVEANNLQPWRTVPIQCLFYVENYMLGGQYERDVDTVVDQIVSYMSSIIPANDGKDAFVFDVDETCISNLQYYGKRRFGGDPYDPVGSKNWARRAICPSIPAILGVYKKLMQDGFKVFLLTGRDEETLGSATVENLCKQGFVGYERLIMRTPSYRGQSAVLFKSAIRKQLVAEGYRIHGNAGDQWSDLLGDCIVGRTFKVPNPMYYVP